MTEWSKQLVIASAIVCCLLVAAFLVSYHLDVRRHCIAITPNLHVGLFDGGTWLYSDEWPYRGGILEIAGYPSVVSKTGFDFPGIYYRYFRSASHRSWSLMLSFWYPIVLFVSPTAVWLFHRKRLQLCRDDST
jgi:hypothetical protein